MRSEMVVMDKDRNGGGQDRDGGPKINIADNFITNNLFNKILI